MATTVFASKVLFRFNYFCINSECKTIKRSFLVSHRNNYPLHTDLLKCLLMFAWVFVLDGRFLFNSHSLKVCYSFPLCLIFTSYFHGWCRQIAYDFFPVLQIYIAAFFCTACPAVWFWFGGFSVVGLVFFWLVRIF